MPLLLLIISTGSLGFLSYIILRHLAILHLPRREKEIEKLVLIIFSIVNAVVTYFLYWIVTKRELFNNSISMKIFFQVFFTAILTSILMSVVYTVIVKLGKSLFDRINIKNKSITIKYTPLMEDVFLPSKGKEVYVWVFTFNKEYIYSGYLDRLEYEEGKFYFSLHALESNDSNEYTFMEVEELFSRPNYSATYKKIVVDNDRSLLYYVMHYDTLPVNEGDVSQVVEVVS